MAINQKKMFQEQRQQLELGYKQDLMEAALESQGNEQLRVAGNLHNSIGLKLRTELIVSSSVRVLTATLPIEASKKGSKIIMTMSL